MKNRKLIISLITLFLVLAALAAVFLIDWPGSTTPSPTQPSTLAASTQMPVGSGRYELKETSISSEPGTQATKTIEMTLYYNSGLTQGEIEPFLIVTVGSQESMVVTGQTTPFYGVSLDDFDEITIALGEDDCSVDIRTKTFVCK